MMRFVSALRRSKGTSAVMRFALSVKRNSSDRANGIVGDIHCILARSDARDLEADAGGLAGNAIRRGVDLYESAIGRARQPQRSPLVGQV